MTISWLPCRSRSVTWPPSPGFNLRGNRLAALPESIGNLAALSQLDIGGIAPPMADDFLRLYVTSRSPRWEARGLLTPGLSVSALTSEQLKMPWLFDLSEEQPHDRQLTVLPESIGNLAALTELDLRGSSVAALPESIGNLAALTKLDLQSCELTVLPESIGNLTALTELDLGGSQLTVLPESSATAALTS